MAKKITITEDDFTKAAATATGKFMDKLGQAAKKQGIESPIFVETLTCIAFAAELTHVLFGEENRDE